MSADIPRLDASELLEKIKNADGWYGTIRSNQEPTFTIDGVVYHGPYWDPQKYGEYLKFLSDFEKWTGFNLLRG